MSRTLSPLHIDWEFVHEALKDKPVGTKIRRPGKKCTIIKEYGVEKIVENNVYNCEYKKTKLGVFELTLTDNKSEFKYTKTLKLTENEQKKLAPDYYKYTAADPSHFKQHYNLESFYFEKIFGMRQKSQHSIVKLRHTISTPEDKDKKPGGWTYGPKEMTCDLKKNGNENSNYTYHYSEKEKTITIIIKRQESTISYTKTINDQTHDDTEKNHDTQEKKLLSYIDYFTMPGLVTIQCTYLKPKEIYYVVKGGKKDVVGQGAYAKVKNIKEIYYPDRLSEKQLQTDVDELVLRSAKKDNKNEVAINNILDQHCRLDNALARGKKNPYSNEEYTLQDKATCSLFEFLINPNQYVSETVDDKARMDMAITVAQLAFTLNKRDMAHRDIKPGNILCYIKNKKIMGSHFRLVDIDFITQEIETHPLYPCGTPEYAANSVYKRNCSGANQDGFALARTIIQSKRNIERCRSIFTEEFLSDRPALECVLNTENNDISKYPNSAIILCALLLDKNHLLEYCWKINSLGKEEIHLPGLLVTILMHYQDDNFNCDRLQDSDVRELITQRKYIALGEKLLGAKATKAIIEEMKREMPLPKPNSLYCITPEDRDILNSENNVKPPEKVNETQRTNDDELNQKTKNNIRLFCTEKNKYHDTDAQLIRRTEQAKKEIDNNEAPLLKSLEKTIQERKSLLNELRARAAVYQARVHSHHTRGYDAGFFFGYFHFSAKTKLDATNAIIEQLEMRKNGIAINYKKFGPAAANGELGKIVEKLKKIVTHTGSSVFSNK